MSRRRKIALAFVAIALLAGAGLIGGRTAIAQFLFDKALDRNVGVDQSARLADGIHVYVCGSGSPMADAERAGPCLAVLAGDQAFVFDVGSGSVRKLLRMGFPVEKLRTTFLTHLHSDHIDGLGELMLQAWIGGSRSQPLPVYGPAGTDKVMDGFMQAYTIDRDFRIAHHGPEVARPTGFGGAAQVLTIPDGEPGSMVAYKDGDVTITVIRVNHAPVAPAFGYRVDYKGRSVSISGDTVYAPGFVAASKGVDLMLHEALNPKMVAALRDRLDQRGRHDAAKIMADIPGYHTSPEQAARAASEAGAGALVLYHLVPAPPARLIEPLFLGDAPKEYSGTLKLAHDGMRIDLPAGGKAIEFDDAF